MKYFTLLFFLILSITTQAKEFKIGYINAQHLLDSSPQLIQANQTILEEFSPKREALLALGEDFKVQLDEFNQDKDSLSEKEIKTRLEALRTAEQNFKEQEFELTEQLNLRKQEELEKIQTVLREAIKAIAEKHKFDLILQNLAYASEKANITPLVSSKLRELFAQ